MKSKIEMHYPTSNRGRKLPSGSIDNVLCLRAVLVIPCIFL